jgi:hypothetical protein
LPGVRPSVAQRIGGAGGRAPCEPSVPRA